MIAFSNEKNGKAALDEFRAAFFVHVLQQSFLLYDFSSI